MADAAGKSTPWHLCPNEPRCPHARVFHDVEDYDDPLPRCCVEGCPCGRKPPPATHRCPPDGEYVTPCCGMTPFELPGTDRITEAPERVTCGGQAVKNVAAEPEPATPMATPTMVVVMPAIVPHNALGCVPSGKGPALHSPVPSGRLAD